MKKRLFIIADAGVDTGFAQVTHNLVQHLSEQWDIAILGINYMGDPHSVQQYARIYNPQAKMQRDFYGLHRVAELISKERPDAVLLINDPWILTQYIKLIDKFPVTKLAYVPVDAPDLDPEYVTPLNAFNHIIAYTEFGKNELTRAGLTTEITTIPHGVNTDVFKPINRVEVRVKNRFDPEWFIVNVTDRNQIRKRIDLAMYAFKVWVETTNKPVSVKLHYHGAMHDEGWDILRLAKQFGIASEVLTPNDRFIITSPDINSQQGIDLRFMPYMYGAANIGLSTTMGEGWGMTTHERMAMRIPMIVPNSSALGEWAKGGVHYVDIAEEPFYNIGGLNTRGAVPAVQSIIKGLEKMYTDTAYRNNIGYQGYKIATKQQYNWKNIAARFHDTLTAAMEKYNDSKRTD